MAEDKKWLNLINLINTTKISFLVEIFGDEYDRVSTILGQIYKIEDRKGVLPKILK